MGGQKSDNEDTGEWISGGASSKVNTRGGGVRSNGTGNY